MRTKRGPQKFSEEFRREAVRLVRESDKSVKALGAELGVSETTLRHWLRALPAGKPTTPGRVLSLEEEVRRLQRENERLREEREILKKATAFFARERR
jgi:transposase